MAFSNHTYLSLDFISRSFSHENIKYLHTSITQSLSPIFFSRHQRPMHVSLCFFFVTIFKLLMPNDNLSVIFIWLLVFQSVANIECIIHGRCNHFKKQNEKTIDKRRDWNKIEIKINTIRYKSSTKSFSPHFLFGCKRKTVPFCIGAKFSFGSLSLFPLVTKKFLG